MDGNTQLLIASSALFAVSLINRFFPPKNINSFYGYRTNNSMKNEESWKYANRIASAVMVKERHHTILSLKKRLYI